AVAGRAPYDLEYRVRRHDGRYEWFKVRGVPIRDAAGQIVRWFGVAANIDGIKRAEEQLAAAKATAEEARAVAESANRAKDQFIAVLSHELRTPLTPAVAAMSLLRTDVRLPADVRETLALVSRNLDLEVRLIADLLDVSRAISGKLHLEKRPVDVAAAIREAAAIVEHDLKARGHVLTIEMPAAPYHAVGDAARLQQVFWNLLRNSIKFSPARSHIAIRARLVAVERCFLASEPCSIAGGECPLPLPGRGDGRQYGGNLVVDVIDQGSGIDPQMLPRLFNVFEQGREARGFGGLGLGLSICKAIVEMHGGTISAHSDGVGLGATFTVRLPVAECALAKEGEALAGEEPAAAQARTVERNGRLRVLLVEDHEDTAEMMELLLMRMGHEVVTARSVAEALAAVAEARPELLISDLGLPDASGLDLIRQLLARGDRIPAIALSGYGTPEDIQKSKAAGFAEHLVKPLNGPAPLAAAIGRLGVRPGRRA
ncbi:MAG TPA: ATP-binding protein, partial [Vicinamibacterales bacterium]|nr:ATP-binding protein [Vicinamibacterales bacterium]